GVTLATGLNTGTPDQERHPYAPYVKCPFSAAKGIIPHRLGKLRWVIQPVPHCRHEFGGAIVGHEKDIRVLCNAQPFEGIQHGPDAAVEIFQHTCERRVVMLLSPRFLLLILILPVCRMLLYMRGKL